MIFTAIAVSLVCTLLILALQARVVTAMARGANLSNHTTKKAVFISSAPVALPLIVLATLTITGFLDVPVSQWQMLTILIAYATGTVVFIKYTKAMELPAKVLESKFSLLDRILVAIIIVLILDVAILAALYPVSDNDALEYRIIARSLPEILGKYSTVDLEESHSGMYAPWSHTKLFIAAIYFLNSVVELTGLPADGSKLVSPLILAATAYAMYQVAGQKSRTTGMVAVVLLLTIPRLSASVSRGGIDIYFVLSVLNYFLAVGLLLNQRALNAMLLGAFIGINTWTHSLALLTLGALAIYLLATNLLPVERRDKRSDLWVFAGSLLFGISGYVGNIFSLGRIVTDTSPILERFGQEWWLYLRYTRHLGDGFDHFVKGMINGLLSPNIYGAVFFLAFIGGMGVLRYWSENRRAQAKHNCKPYADNGPETYTLEIAALSIIGSYYLVSIPSIAMADLNSIKNDRYLLVVTPAAILLTTSAVYKASLAMMRAKAKATTVNYEKVILISILCASMLHLALYLGYWYTQWIGITERRDWSKCVTNRGAASYASKLLNCSKNPFPGIELMVGAASEVSADSRVLTFRPADTFYLNRRILSYLDPAAEEFYNQPDKVSLKATLDRADIKYIHVPDYTPPMFTHTKFMELLGDRWLATIIKDVQGHQIYMLRDASTLVGPGLPPVIEKFHGVAGLCRKTNSLGIGGGIGFRTMQKERIDLLHTPMESHATIYSSRFTRVEYKCEADDGMPEGSGRKTNNHGDREFLAEIALRGAGFVRVYVSTKRLELEGNSRRLLFDAAVNTMNEPIKLVRRFRVAPEEDIKDISFELIGRSSIEIENLHIRQIGE